MFKVNNKDIRTAPSASISIADFEQANASWVTIPNQSDFRKSYFKTIYYENELNKKIELLI